jgi:hypothetical protein
MTTYTKAMTTQATMHPGREKVRGWAKTTLTRERLQEAALCAATVSLIGVVALFLHKAMESCLILRF